MQMIEAFLHKLWAGATGYVEIVAGANEVELDMRGWFDRRHTPDPNRIGLVMWTRPTGDFCRRIRVPHERKIIHTSHMQKILTTIQHFEQCYGNVYVSLSSYASEEQAKRRHNPQPSRALFFDDVRDPQPLAGAPPFSMLVETSPNNYQAYYCLSQIGEPERLTQIALQISHQLGADLTGIDRQQLVRVPGTRNTKQCAANWQIPAVQYGPETTQGALRQAFGLTRHVSEDLCHTALCSTASIPSGENGSHNPDWQQALAEAEQYRGMVRERGNQLMRPDGTPRYLNAQHILCYVLRGEKLWGMAAAEWNGKDPSRSGFEYHLVGALWRNGCPLPILIAIMTELAAERRISKGDRWFCNFNLYNCLYGRKGWAHIFPQIKRISLDELERRRDRDAAYPPVQPQTVVAAESPVTRSKTRITSEHILEYYRGNAMRYDNNEGRYFGSTRSIDAQELGISKGTLDRRDRELVAQGAIRIETDESRRFRTIHIIHFVPPTTAELLGAAGLGDSTSTQNLATDHTSNQPDSALESEINVVATCMNHTPPGGAADVLVSSEAFATALSPTGSVPVPLVPPIQTESDPNIASDQRLTEAKWLELRDLVAKTIAELRNEFLVQGTPERRVTQKQVALCLKQAGLALAQPILAQIYRQVRSESSLWSVERTRVSGLGTEILLHELAFLRRILLRWAGAGGRELWVQRVRQTVVMEELRRRGITLR